MAEITTETVLAAVDAAVAERGEDYRYPRTWRARLRPRWQLWNRDNACAYVRPDGDGPACLIGDVLHRHGISLARLRGFERRSAGDVLGELAPTLPPHVVGWLDCAQERQDQGDPWGAIRDDLHEVLAADLEGAPR